VTNRIATGFEFQPLLGGDVLVEFFGSDGKTCNTQVINGEAFRHLPILAYVAQVAVGQGAEAAKKMMEELMRRT
jgi:hypothetical protein